MTFILSTIQDNLVNLIQIPNQSFKQSITNSFSTVIQQLKGIPIEHYAQTTNVMFKERNVLYLKNDEDRGTAIRGYVRHLAANVFGIDYNVSYTIPLLSSVEGINNNIIMIDVAFVLVTFFFCLLSILLIYSLMMSVI